MITDVLTERQEELAAEAEALLGELSATLEALEDGTGAARAAAAVGALDPLFVMVVTGAPGASIESLARVLGGGGGPRRLAVEAGLTRDAGDRPPTADLALFLTSARRPLAPVEHAPLEAAAAGAARLLVVVDEAEMLRLSEDVERMEEAVAVTAERIVGTRPWAQAVSLAPYGGSAPGRESLVPALAARVVGILRTPDVVRPKLLDPVVAGLHLARGALAATQEGLAALGDDLANLEAVEARVQRFEAETATALREAQDEAAEATAGFEARAGHLVRRGGRPFRLAGRLHERFDREASGRLRDRLRAAAARLDERIAEAAAAGARAVEERVAAFPTERVRALGGAGEAVADPGGSAPEADPGSGPVTAELEHSWQRRPDREGGRHVVESLRRGSFLALVLVALGIAFAAVPVLWGFGRGVGVLPIALGGGLGGASILAALTVLSLRRRRLTEEIAARAEDLRGGAAAALAAGAERAAGRGRAALLAPVAPYVRGVAAERDRLTAGRSSLARLAGRLEDLRDRVARA